MTFKKNRNFVANSLLALTLSATSLYSHAESQDRSNWTSNDYWEETQLSFKSLLNGIVSDSNCKVSHQKLVACVAVVNKMHDLKNPENKDLVVLDFENGISFKKVKKEEKTLKSYLLELNNQLRTTISEEALTLMDGTFDEALADFEKSSVTDLNDSKIAADLYNTYLTIAVDPHSYIMPTAQMEDSSRASSDNRGIGIFLQTTEVKGVSKIQVTEVIENSPAEKGGIKAGDIFLQVNDQNSFDTMMKELGAKEVFQVKVLRNENVLSLNLTKGVYTIVNVKSKTIISNNRTYGYIKLRSFSDPTGCFQIKNKIRKFKKDPNFSGMILDLRNNGGGLVTEAVCILESYLTPGSTTWMTKDLEGRELVYDIFKPEKYENLLQNVHNVVLVNGYSASASEAVSMYLQDYEKAIIMGERSFGKGSMQGISEYDREEFGEAADGILTAETQALYYGPKGISPQVDGVSPDIKVFPKIDQESDTEFLREADLYAFPILDRNVEKSELVNPNRVKNIEKIKECMDVENKVARKYDSLNKAKQSVFDNQLESAVEALNCANKMVKVRSNINIKKTTDLEMITRNEKLRRVMRELNHLDSEPQSEENPFNFEIEPMEIEIEIEKPVIKPSDISPDDEDDDDN